MLLLLLNFSGFSQTNYFFAGNNGFRNFAWGVGSQTYNIRLSSNQYGNQFGNFITNYLSCGVYGVTNFNFSTTGPNTLKIQPFSLNNQADYIDGVSTLDLIRLQAHLNGTDPFVPPGANNTQKIEGGFKLLSAEATNDNAVTSADVTAIQNLVLGVTSSLSRNSWEWCRSSDVTSLPTTFATTPWSRTIKATWPNVAAPTGSGATGTFGQITYTGTTAYVTDVSRHDFKAAKIGDIRNGSNGAGSNSQLCAPGIPYFNGSNIADNRSSYGVNILQIKSGSKIQYQFDIESNEALLGFELPLFVDHKKAKISTVNISGFTKNCNLKYHFDKYRDRLVVIGMDDDGLDEILIDKNASIVVELEAITDIENIENLLYTVNDRKIELINKNIDYADASIGFEIVNVIPKNLEIYFSNSDSKLNIISNMDQESEVKIYSTSGHVLKSFSLFLNSGLNTIDITKDLHSLNVGMYFLNITTKDGNETIKLID